MHSARALLLLPWLLPGTEHSTAVPSSSQTRRASSTCALLLPPLQLCAEFVFFFFFSFSPDEGRGELLLCEEALLIYVFTAVSCKATVTCVRLHLHSNGGEFLSAKLGVFLTIAVYRAELSTKAARLCCCWVLPALPTAIS